MIKQKEIKRMFEVQVSKTVDEVAFEPPPLIVNLYEKTNGKKELIIEVDGLEWMAKELSNEFVTHDTSTPLTPVGEATHIADAYVKRLSAAIEQLLSLRELLTSKIS